MGRGKLALRIAGVALVAALVPLVLIGCGKPTEGDADNTWPADKTGPKVVVSFAPLYCFAANVAGDDATVKNVMTTTGPHEFSPTPSDVRLVTKADVMFVIGLGLDEKQAEAMKTGSGNTSLDVVELGEKLPRDKLLEGHNDHDEKDKGADHHHDQDPHVWLSPDHAVLLVNLIRDTLKEKDPAHAAGYEARAAAYVAKLEKLKADGLAELKGGQDNRLVTFHDSMAYFANAYGLDIRGVLTQKPGQEPDDKQMRRLIRICTDETKPTRVIAVEPQYSGSNSGETLKKELAAKGVKNPVLVEFNTLETVQPGDLKPDWYEKEMARNVKALAAALK
jgi:ABC-type Zn uptake system ZnuABC Zn-binding protein ZnuA